MKRKKILLLTYAFPPIAAPESFLAAKTMAHFPSYQVDVVCLSPLPHFLNPDESLKDFVQAGFDQIFQVPYPRWFELLHATSWSARLASLLSQFPDKTTWLLGAVKKKLTQISLQDYNHLVTWSQFHGAHLAGLWAKARFPHLIWTAHLSDPWVNNPYNFMAPWSNLWHRPLEKKVFEACDHLWVTCPRSRELMVSGYRPAIAAKMKIVAHPFVEELYPPQEPQACPPLVLRHLGNFYGKRSPQPFLEMLKKYSLNHPQEVKDLKIEFYGSMGGHAIEPSLASWVTHHPAVPYLKSLELISQSHGMIVIDAPAKESVFLPSKLIDAVGARKPIFGITPQGTTSDLLEQLQLPYAHPESPPEIYSKFSQFISMVRHQRWSMSERVRSRYEVRSLQEEIEHSFLN